MAEIYDVCTSFQALRFAEAGLKYKEVKRTWKPNVYWYWGSTGTGKTRQAVTEAVDFWMSGKNLKWFEGYDAHKNVIFDDFRAEHCEFSDLLRLLDRYEYRVECKGGSRQFLAENIWITTTSPPELLYHNKTGSYTRKINHHKPSSFCYYIKCFDESIYNKLPVKYSANYDNEDVAQIFIDKLEEEVKEIYEKFKKYKFQ